MIDYKKNKKKYIGKKIKIKYTKDFLIEQKKNQKKIEDENKLQDQSYDTQRLLKEKGLSSVSEIDFSEGILTRVDIVSDYTTDEDYSIILDNYKSVYLSYIESVEEIE
ncbi:hypothetical protein [Fusobacterium polymorphum]|uniref:hypothetical protein n=1 Tax=Fusobacterium nucleatum subsp. polymorphum TaxID=76857 RepID=UPI003D812BB4